MKTSLARRSLLLLVAAPLVACAADAGPAPEITQSEEAAQVIVQKPNYRRQALVDFTGDKVADYADHNAAGGASPSPAFASAPASLFVGRRPSQKSTTSTRA